MHAKHAVPPSASGWAAAPPPYLFSVALLRSSYCSALVIRACAPAVPSRPRRPSGAGLCRVRPGRQAAVLLAAATPVSTVAPRRPGSPAV